MINAILKAFRKKKKTCINLRNDRFRIFKVGTKVKLSEKALFNFPEDKRQFFSKSVFQVVDYEISLWEGVRLKLNCGSTLWADEAEEVDINTPLWQ